MTTKYCYIYWTVWVFNNLFSKFTGLILESMSQGTSSNLWKPIQRNSYQACSCCLTPLFRKCRKSFSDNFGLCISFLFVSRGWIYFIWFSYDWFLLVAFCAKKISTILLHATTLLNDTHPIIFCKWPVSVLSINFCKTYRLGTFRLEFERSFLIFRNQLAWNEIYCIISAGTR